MTDSKAKTPFIYTIILYTLGLLLFLEWLYPVGELTDTSEISVFILYTLFCFLITAINVYWWLSFLAKGMGLLFVLNRLFFEGSVIRLEWLEFLWADLYSNITFLMHQDWYHLTPLFRSMLFLILIWLMSYLLYYWFVTMKYVFVFVALTIVYVSLLDTFTIYDADFPIVRIVIISFLSLGLTKLVKEQAREGIPFSKYRRRLIWPIPIMAFILISVGIGFAAPKFSPQWPDPVPFIEGLSTNSDGFGFSPGNRTVGYGEDDTELGGSFSQDNTTVFEAEATEKQYWRIETKDVYTGKGWERSEETSFEQQGEGQISLDIFTNEVETSEEFADITFTGDVDLNKVIYPYGIKGVQDDGDTEFLLDTSSESIHTQQDGKKVSLSSYSLTYDEPSFDLDALKDASESDPQDIKERYTQLPDELPDRVEELAMEIADDYSTRYEKAKAIEQYFNREGFIYQISDVPVPAEDEDYVDQFLYDTKAGYCDNYSTSMAVMLRSIDIPTRWVKGFTGGEKVDEKEDENGDTRNVYEVANSNAHSWVEVYFPDIGWVPFEPTQGFSNEADFFEESDDTDDILDPTEGNEDETPGETEEIDPDNGEIENNDEETEEPETGEKGESSASYWYWYLLAVLVVIIALAWYAYLKRFQIKAYILRKKCMGNRGDAGTYSQAYLFLLRLLRHKGIDKGPEETLREFASRVDLRYRENGMGRLTAYYEEMVYNKHRNNVHDDDFCETWGRLVEEIMKE